MVSKRVVAALLLSFAVAAAALAQSAAADASVASPAEFGRVSGGELDLLMKHSRNLSGTFGISTSRSNLPFSKTGLSATLGGTLVPDRVWFFAAAEKNNNVLTSRYGSLPQTAADTSHLSANLNAQIGDRQTLAATFAGGREANFTNPTATLPTSFLSLHYTGVVSSNMFFTANISRQTAQPYSPFATVQPQ